MNRLPSTGLHEVAGVWLTQTERQIFDALQMYDGWMETRALLVVALGEPNTGLRTHIWRLRGKLRDTRWKIENDPARGYRLVG